MSKVKIVLNSAGVQSLLKDVGSTTCVRLANEAATRCGPGYEAQTRNYPERTGAVVKAVTAEAMRDNMENDTILKAVR